MWTKQSMVVFAVLIIFKWFVFEGPERFQSRKIICYY